MDDRKESMYEITQSEKNDELKCQMLHYFRYVLQIAPIRLVPALWTGSWVHLGLRLYYEGAPDYLLTIEQGIGAELALFADENPNLWPEDEEKLLNQKALILAMLEGWPEFVAEHDLDLSIEIVATELEFSMRLPSPKGKSRCLFRGRVDGIARHIPTGKLFLIEHKTAAQVGDSYISHLQLDQQIPLYIAGIRECYGYETIGCIYNILRKQAPGPRVKAPLYYREWVWRNETEIQQALESIYWTYREITRPRRTIIPNRSQMTCPGCTYRTLCLEDSPEARSHFQKKERKHEELS